jgi:peptide/nickel transport system substrate-binding protein
MMIPRRRFLQGSAFMLAAPSLGRAQSSPPRDRILRAVMHADLRSFDPLWATAYITSYHGAMVYDTLFGSDANSNPQPQMVEKYSVSDDHLTYRFALRDGLRFSDGSPVTAADCVASMRRFGARDSAGQLLFSHVADTRIKDDVTFELVLKERYGLVLETMAKTSSCMWMMRTKEAETDPSQQITEIVGSGPFIFNRDATKMGASYVYDRNPNYVPRAGVPSGTAGAKIVKLDRVIWDNIGDEQTALSALKAGEIDFYETPPIEFVKDLDADKNITVKVLNATGNVGIIRLNWLYPPFDNLKARRAMLYLVNQADILAGTFGASQYYRECASIFGCGTKMENDANTDWFKGKQNIAKAAQLFKEAGYDGRPVVILQPTNLPMPNVAAQLIAQWLRTAGVNAELAVSDWGAIVARRAVMDAPDKGGWNIFITYTVGSTMDSPILFPGHPATGRKGWFGWPADERHEQLRTAWTMAESFEERVRIAREMQDNAWNFVPHVLAGQWLQPAAWRTNVSGILPIPDCVPFWNIEKS